MAYAWTNLEAKDKDGNVTKKIKPGDEVSAGDLGIEDDEFEQLQAVGAVRDAEYPTPEGYQGSPVEYAKEQLAAMQLEGEGGEFFPDNGSMTVTPQMQAQAEASIEKIGYDPEKGPEDQSLSNTVDEDSEEVAPVVAAKSASAVQPAVNPSTGTNG
jgi:hypothetical protein